MPLLGLRRCFALAFVASSLLAACAQGEAETDTVLDAPDGTASTTKKDSGTSKPLTGEDSGGGGFDATVDSASEETSDAGVSDAAIVSDAGIDSGIPASCAAPVTCQQAINLGTVSGDTSGSPLQTTGVTAKWLKVNVTENNNDPFNGQNLRLKVELTSPPGANFDLFVYRNYYTPNTLECTQLDGMSTNTSILDSATLDWGEGTGGFGNGSDDGRLVTIEVRYASGTCTPNSSWSLTVTGNPP